jgi:hypothetical protein
MAPKLRALVDRYTKMTASDTKMTAIVSLSEDDAYSDEESGEGRGPAPPRAQSSAAALGPAPPRTSADGQPLAAGKRSKKNICDVQGSVGKQLRSKSKLASPRAAAAEKRRNKNDTGKNATRQPSRGSGGGTPQQEQAGHGQQAEKKGKETGTKGNWRDPKCRAERIEKAVQEAAKISEQEQRADRKEKEVQEAAKTDEANAAAPEKKRPARKTQHTPGMRHTADNARQPHRPPSRGRRSAASSSAATSSRGPPSRGGQPSAAASTAKRDQPSAAASPGRRSRDIPRPWAASSSAAASSRGPPSRGGQPSAAASSANSDQPSAAARPGRRSFLVKVSKPVLYTNHKGQRVNEFWERVDQYGFPHKARGCQGSGSKQKRKMYAECSKMERSWQERERAREDEDEWQADAERSEHAREDAVRVRKWQADAIRSDHADRRKRRR